MGYEYVIFIVLPCALATGIVGRAKGGSFFIWAIVGGVLPLIGLIAAVLMRNEDTEPERECPNCNKRVKLYVQVCPRCGTDLYLPDPREVRQPSQIQAEKAARKAARRRAYAPPPEA